MLEKSLEVVTKTGYGYNVNVLIKMCYILYFDKELKRRERYFFTFNEWIILHNLKKTYHENNKINSNTKRDFLRLH